MRHSAISACGAVNSVIFFGEDWGRHPSTGQFIAQELLDRGYRVLWIDSLGLRQPSLSRVDVGRIFKKLRTALFTQSSESEKDSNGPENRAFIHLVPLVIPFHKYAGARVINRWTLVRSIRGICARHKMVDPVLVVACPGAEGVVGRLREKKSIYYCADEYSVFPGMDRNLVGMLEQKLIRRVNVLVVTSRGLLKTKKREGIPIHFLPHGVDYLHFSKADSGETVMPEEARTIKKPVIGYHGLIQDLIDFDIIRGIARKRPEWSIVMIGEAIFDAKKIPEEKNIHFLGKKRYEDLPSYIKAFDVGLIPYKIVERTVYANPVKLREYLASGKPIVSTALPEVLHYRDVVRIADDANGFVKEIESLLSNDRPADSKMRMEKARAESWDVIVDRFEKIMKE